MGRAKKPPYLSIVSRTQRWNRPITAAKSSGSIFVASSVDPTRSQKTAVSCRRSIIAAKDAECTAAAAPGLRPEPQWGQNRAMGGVAVLHEGQVWPASAVHCAQ